MEGKVLGICTIVAVLGIISAATGFAAEATRVKVSDVYIDLNFECVYPKSPALGLGIVAVLFAIITRVVISVSVGVCSCCRSDSRSSPCARLSYILSWIASVIAVVLLLAATALNNRQGGEYDTYGRVTCYVVKPGIFATGAVMSLLTAFFGIVAYVSLSSSATQTTSTNPGVALPVASNFDPEKNPVAPNNHINNM